MPNIIIGSLILIPLIICLLMLLFRWKGLISILVSISALFLSLFSVFVCFYTPFSSNIRMLGNIKISSIILLGDTVLLLFLIIISLKYKKILSVCLALFQIIPLLYFEFVIKPEIEVKSGYIAFLNDNLSLAMLFLIMIIGSLIAVFAIRYMDEYEEHQHVRVSRQPYFFFLIFLFLGAMCGIVLSNNLIYMYFFWEITTLCSFLLIGFSKTEEATNNAFRALWMNLLGGTAFIIAIILFYKNTGTYEISKILLLKNRPEVLLPLAFLSIAAFTKAAQFPFHSWLLGAMVAPTPVSALLHSSTMVKAGVYLLVRFSPLLTGSSMGYIISVIGSFTFLMASALAISQSNSKRVLAYSTISNLGLIVATAGIGTPIAISAAILLIIFHGVSKALLFLCVGTIEHGIGSRDIENMDGLISKMPLVGFLTAIGMFSMLLPPFGVIITKLLGIEAAVRIPIVLLLIILGSALTVVYWTKWMGKILSISNKKEKILESYSMFTVIPLSIIAIAVTAVSVGITLIYKFLVVPYIQMYWNTLPDINLNSMMLIPIFIVILCIFLLIPILILNRSKFTTKSPYLCGENDCEVNFKSISDKVEEVSVSNYYLEEIIKEEKITLVSNIIGIMLIIYLFGVIL